MTALIDELSPDQRLALVYGPARFREQNAAILALDRQLGRAVSAASEPILAQVRLSWWRDEIGRIGSGYVSPEPCLQALSMNAANGLAVSDRLTSLVDAWEEMSVAPIADTGVLERFGEQRGWAVFGASAAVAGLSLDDAMISAGMCWSLTDFARRSRDPDTAARALVIAAGSSGFSGQLPRTMRSFALLARFAERDVRRGPTVSLAEGSPRRILEAWGLLLGTR